MKLVKNVSVLLTATAVVGMLAACGNSNDNKDASATASGATSSATASGAEKLKKISLFQSKVEIAEPLEKLAETYKKETGNEVEVGGPPGTPT